MSLTHLSLFAGIGGFDLGFDRAGMVTVGQVENDPACVRVLERWWPDVARWGDIRDFHPGLADVVSGGFPCQDVSVAGKRAGLAGSRSRLWWEFRRILAESRPEWLVVENVPGLLSSNSGRDFAAIVGSLGELGFHLAWRVLDAQWFGVAQRRRRVFVVGHVGDWRAPVQVLDLAQGCCGDSPPRRQAGASIAGSLTGGSGSSSAGNPEDNRAQAGFLIPFQLRGREGGAMPEVEPDGICGSLRAGDGGSSRGRMIAFAPANQGVRRLTPVECARLQGFPDNWNDHLSDSTRYRQYGNAVCVPVAEWLGRRIVEAV